MNNNLPWKTAITKIQPNEVRLRGYRLDELMGKVSFGQVVYLALKGELPAENIGKLIDAMLVSSIDHGATPPSTLSAITVASTGAPLNAAVAGGILAISRFHGGAIEDCMGVLLQTREKSLAKQISFSKAGEEIVEEYKAAGRRISGFGHRIHTEDPRTKKLFELSKEYGVKDTFIQISYAIESALEKQAGKKLPINVDGAIAAILCELEFSPKLANAFFIMARVPGLVAHIFEEQTRYKPMRTIDPKNHEYDGAKDRSL
ncbi:MAG: citryl-CoA lyase [bacterium]